MLGDKTLLQKIIENELEEFQENSQISYTSIKTPLDLGIIPYDYCLLF